MFSEAFEFWQFWGTKVSQLPPIFEEKVEASYFWNNVNSHDLSLWTCNNLKFPSNLQTVSSTTLYTTVYAEINVNFDKNTRVSFQFNCKRTKYEPKHRVVSIESGLIVRNVEFCFPIANVAGNARRRPRIGSKNDSGLWSGLWSSRTRNRREDMAAAVSTVARETNWTASVSITRHLLRYPLRLCT